MLGEAKDEDGKVLRAANIDGVIVGLFGTAERGRKVEG